MLYQQSLECMYGAHLMHLLHPSYLDSRRRSNESETT